MPVDTFGRNGDTVCTGKYISNVVSSFLRRDVCNPVTGAIDMYSNIVKNVADLLTNKDVTT